MPAQYKKLPFHVVATDVLCKECGKPIKMNLIHRKLTLPRLCYKCWKRQEYLIKNAK